MNLFSRLLHRYRPLISNPVLLGVAEESRPDDPAVLLTNDLTEAVVDEAISKNVQVIICYRKYTHSYPHAQ